jgi:uncharacterized protein YecE (DUF72 family)
VIYVGTSGFKFDDWKGPFYPPDLPQTQWLNFYARQFNCLEVNASYYTLIHPATFARMAEKTPAGFLFTVKAYRGMTHEFSEETEGFSRTFRESLGPLSEAGKLGCVLAQFPNKFRNVSPNRQYLLEFQERLGDIPLVYEFRSRDWIRDETFAFLRERGIGYCAVDEPQFKTLIPPVAEVTSDIGYVRFHGRNYDNWWSGDVKKRYDYLYSLDELNEWVPKITALDDAASKVFVFMNNCFAAQAAKNAAQMKELLQPRLANL